MPGFELDRLAQDDQPGITQRKHQMQPEVGRVLGSKALSSSRYSLDEDSAIFSGSERKDRLPCIPMQIFAESYAGLKVESILKTEYLAGIIVPVLYQIGIGRREDLMTRGHNSKPEEGLLFKLFSNQEFHCECEGNCDYPESGLLWAARMGKEEVLKLLLDETDINVNYKPQNGVTALHLATRHGYEAMAKQLLEKGSSVDCQDFSNETPLHYAAENGDRGLVALLLEYGANVHHLDVVGSNPLHKAVKSGIQNVIELLIHRGANVNEQNNLGWTALHIAAAYGKSVHLLLLEEGARINAKDIHGQTPLHKAVQKKEEPIIKDLIDYGANINPQDNSGFSPLHIAADLGCDGIIKLLVENGATIDLRNRDGYTPLRVASFNGDRETVKQLLSLSELSSSLHSPELASQVNIKNTELVKRAYQENKRQGQRMDVKR
jgi:ankyrin repeat protein